MHVNIHPLTSRCLHLIAVVFAMVVCGTSLSQQNHVISNTIKGSVVGLGWGAGQTSGSIPGQLYFDCSTCSTVGNSYLIAVEANVFDTIPYLPSYVLINGVTYTFDEETRISPKFGPNIHPNGSFFKYSYFINFQPIQFQCNGTNYIDFYIPYQDWRTSALVYYLVIECLDSLADETAYAIVLNTGDADPNLMVPTNNPIQLQTVDFSKDVGFSIVGSVMNNMNGDASNVVFNNHLLGKIGGKDQSSVQYHASGVRGHFRYQNGMLEGLDDDTPDLVMDSTDALAKVQSFMGGNNEVHFSCMHEDSLFAYAYNSNPVLAAILTYTPLCASFPVSVPKDTNVCFGDKLQLNVSGGTAYQWYPAVGLSCSDCPNPLFSADTSVFYTVKIWNNDSCFVSRSLKINVLPEIEIRDSLVISSVCGTSTGEVHFPFLGYSYSYTMLGGQTLNHFGDFQNLSSGNYLFYIQNPSGCHSDTLLVHVPKVNPTEIGFTASPQSGASPLEVHLNNTSTNAVHFQWYLNNVYQGNTLSNLLLEDEGVYTIQLVGWQTDSSCADTASLTIMVYDSLVVTIPNIFTPDNDGINDVFGLNVNLEVNCDLLITNRWGNNMFSYSGSLAPGFTPLWDAGDATDGVYFYTVSITINDCESYAIYKKLESCSMKKNGFVTIRR